MRVKLAHILNHVPQCSVQTTAYTLVKAHICYMYRCVTVDIMYFPLRGVDPAGEKHAY